MAGTKIDDATPKLTVTPTDVIPLGDGSGLPKTYEVSLLKTYFTTDATSAIGVVSANLTSVEQVVSAQGAAITSINNALGGYLTSASAATMLTPYITSVSAESRYSHFAFSLVSASNGTVSASSKSQTLSLRGDSGFIATSASGDSVKIKFLASSTFLTSSSAATMLGAYLTSSSAITLIAPYITSASAVTLVAPYITSSSALTLLIPYTTSASVVTLLGSYLTSVSALTLLGSYLTSVSALAAFAKVSSSFITVSADSSGISASAGNTLLKLLGDTGLIRTSVVGNNTVRFRFAASSTYITSTSVASLLVPYITSASAVAAFGGGTATPSFTTVSGDSGGVSASSGATLLQLKGDSGFIRTSASGRSITFRFAASSTYITSSSALTLLSPYLTSVSAGTRYDPGTFGITVDGGGTTPTSGSKGFAPIAYKGTITNWYLAADQSGTCGIDVRRGGVSLIGGSGNTPTLISQQFASASVSSWTSIDLAIGDNIEFYITSANTVTRFTLVIRYNKTG